MHPSKPASTTGNHRPVATLALDTAAAAAASLATALAAGISLPTTWKLRYHLPLHRLHNVLRARLQHLRRLLSRDPGPGGVRQRWQSRLQTYL